MYVGITRARERLVFAGRRPICLGRTAVQPTVTVPR